MVNVGARIGGKRSSEERLELPPLALPRTARCTTRSRLPYARMICGDAVVRGSSFRHALLLSLPTSQVRVAQG